MIFSLLDFQRVDICAFCKIAHAVLYHADRKVRSKSKFQHDALRFFQRRLRYVRMNIELNAFVRPKCIDKPCRF